MSDKLEMPEDCKTCIHQKVCDEELVMLNFDGKCEEKIPTSLYIDEYKKGLKEGKAIFKNAIKERLEEKRKNEDKQININRRSSSGISGAGLSDKNPDKHRR